MKYPYWVLSITSLFCGLSAIDLQHGSAATRENLILNKEEINTVELVSEIDDEKLSSNCKPGMVEVDGDYCHFAQERCLKWVDANSSYPRMCEQFEYPTKCLSKKTHMHFCIDKYEAQNDIGQVPEVFVDWFTAKEKCESSGKRLCDTRELTLACEGPELKPYPYGYVRDTKKCNIGNTWIDPDKTSFEKIDRRVPSGAYSDCKSDFGVYDGVGNTDEWSINVEGSMVKAPFKSALFGGHYVSGVRNRCRDLGVPSVTTSHGPTAKNYEISYRCCSNIMDNI